MVPDLHSSKSGSQQFMELYNGLKTNFAVRAIWLQVTSPTLWSPSVLNNTQFITNIIATA
ncbi:hypothetical protein GCK32_021107, partial [Trichostrongylus colubriformis]